MAKGRVSAGSVVVLNSGGPNMLVKSSKDGTVCCVWADGQGECQETAIPSACVTVVLKPSKAKT